jgi:hypothetical protein
LKVLTQPRLPPRSQANGLHLSTRGLLKSGAIISEFDNLIGYIVHFLLIAKLQAIMMKSIAHPGAAQSKRRQTDIILAPDTLIF